MIISGRIYVRSNVGIVIDTVHRRCCNFFKQIIYGIVNIMGSNVSFAGFILLQMIITLVLSVYNRTLCQSLKRFILIGVVGVFNIFK